MYQFRSDNLPVSIGPVGRSLHGTPYPPPKTDTTWVNVALAVLPGLISHLAGKRQSHPAGTAGFVRRQSAGGCRRGREGQTLFQPQCGSWRQPALPSQSAHTSRAVASAQKRALACKLRTQCARTDPRGAGIPGPHEGPRLLTTRPRPLLH